MARTVLQEARSLLNQRKFSSVVTLLDGNEEMYEDSFDFFLMFGIACLYMDDIGSAYSAFQKARRIKINSSDLLLGQAAIFLRRGDTARAIEYYLDVLNIEPGNSIAKKAMAFIRKTSDYSQIHALIETGKIKKFYPPLGFNPNVVKVPVTLVIFAAVFCGVFLFFKPEPEKNYIGPRANLESLVLTDDEKRNPQSGDLSGTVIRYILDNKTINSSYEKALSYFQNGRDNECQVELNRLLNSNASLSIKKKAQILSTYLDEPGFDTLKDNYTYSQVSQDPLLYLDCYVIWSGRISNAQTYDNGKWSCSLLVGYEDMRNVEGIVTVNFDYTPTPEIDGEKPVRFIGKVQEQDGKVVLWGRGVYQPLKGYSLP